jgi:hypothetical protein
MPTQEKFSYTPPEVAELLTVAHEKVLYWVNSGELKARNLRTAKTGQRPRYQILHADLMAFLDSRLVKEHPPKTTRAARQTVGDYY